MQPIGPKIAEGRDGEVFEHDAGKVLRRVRDGRSLEHEARIMAYVHEHGYPVPRVYDAGVGYLVMDRIDGKQMIDAAIPFKIGRSGRLLADLHRQLHEIPAPDWLPPGALPGDRVVHSDLHPLNVLMSADGPVVIDWSNAVAGEPAFDVADTWLLFSCADTTDLPSWQRALVPLMRRVFLRSFLAMVDVDAARSALPIAAERRAADRNTTPGERDRMREFARRASNL